MTAGSYVVRRQIDLCSLELTKISNVCNVESLLITPCMVPATRGVYKITPEIWTPLLIRTCTFMQCSPLKLGNRGKYHIIIQEYRAIISEYYSKDYVIPHQINLNIIDLPT